MDISHIAHIDIILTTFIIAIITSLRLESH